MAPKTTGLGASTLYSGGCSAPAGTQSTFRAGQYRGARRELALQPLAAIDGPRGARHLLRHRVPSGREHVPEVRVACHPEGPVVGAGVRETDLRHHPVQLGRGAGLGRRVNPRRGLDGHQHASLQVRHQPPGPARPDAFR